MKPPNLPGPKSVLIGQTSDRTRLLFLSALMIVFVAAFGYLRWRAVPEDPQEQQSAYLPEVEKPRVVPVSSVKIDHALLAQVKDDDRTSRLIREPAPYGHLLAEARKLTRGDLSALGVKRIDPQEVLADPGLHRGQVYEVKGFLESVEVVQGDVYQEVRGTLLDPTGQRYAFSVLREPDAAVGEVVRLQGFFFKVFAVETAPGEYDDQVLHLVGRALPRAFLEMAPVDDLSDAPLHQLRDFDVTDMIDIQEDVLYHVLNFVRSLSDEERASTEYEDVEWAQLRQDPDRYRGRPVRVFANRYASLEWPRQLGPDGENPLDVDVFHDGILKLPHDRIYRWIGFDPVPEDALGESRLVFLKGIFYKNFAWENSRGDVLTAPLIVAVDFDRFEIGENQLVEWMGYIIAAITGTLVLVFFVGVFNDRRTSLQFRKEYLRRKRKRLDSMLAGGGPASPTAPATPDDDEAPRSPP